MVPTGSLLAFAVTAFALIVVPGPSVLFVISRGVALGAGRPSRPSSGTPPAPYSQVVVVALGLGALIERSATLFTAVKLVGAAYIVFLGVQAFRHRREARERARRGHGPARHAPDPLGGVRRRGHEPQGGGLHGRGPAAVHRPGPGPVPLQLLVLGLVFVAIALVSDSIWGLAAGYARAWLGRSPQRLEALGGLGGVVMIGLGVRLALVGRRD